jgi:AbiU2
MANGGFGYVPELPEDVRGIYMDLCQDVASLHAKWGLYLDLFSTAEATTLLSQIAPGTFQIVEESLRTDILMLICRLSDPPQSCGKDNLSMAVLARQFAYVEGLGELVTRLREECEPVRLYRDKRIAHNDLRSALNPKDNLLGKIGRQRLDKILTLAAEILRCVLRRVVANADLGFHFELMGSGRDLLYWLEVARQHEAERLGL